MSLTARVGPIGRASRDTLQSTAERIALAAAGRIRVGQLTVVMPDGRRHTFGDAGSTRRAEIQVHDDEAAVQILLRGETGAGEAYMDGLWSSPDLEAPDRAGRP